jgi:hypothetical protein
MWQCQSFNSSRAERMFLKLGKKIMHAVGLVPRYVPWIYILKPKQSFIFWRPVYETAMKVTIVTETSSGFLQSLQKNSGLVSYRSCLLSYTFLATHPLFIIILQSLIWRHITSWFWQSLVIQEGTVCGGSRVKFRCLTTTGFLVRLIVCCIII